MAARRVTQEALAYIGEAIRNEGMERPLITAQWNVGQADITRGPDGQPQWDRESSHWRVTILDLVAFERQMREAMPTEDLVLPSANAVISGLNFFLYGRPGNRMLEDCELGLIGGELHVLENAI